MTRTNPKGTELLTLVTPEERAFAGFEGKRGFYTTG